MKILLAYATRGKATEEYAAEIAKVLRSKNRIVDVVNLKKARPNLQNYTKIIAGTGIRMNRIYPEALKFLKNSFHDKKVALFVTSMEPKKDVMKKYVSKILENKSINPISTEVFGGRMRFLWKTEDKTDKEAAARWAKNIDKKLK